MEGFTPGLLSGRLVHVSSESRIFYRRIYTMGEIADMMIDGTLCGGCGCYLDGDADGFTRFCEDCKNEIEEDALEE